MTLKRRLSFQIAVMLAGVALLGTAGVVGVSTLHTDLSISLRANEQLRQVYTIGVRVAAARSLLERSPARRGEVAAELQQAADLFDSYGSTPADRWIDGTADAASELSKALANASTDLQRSRDSDLSAFNAPYARFADLIAATRHAVAERQAIADRKQQWTLALVAALATLVMTGTITVAIRLYRGVIRPLGEVRASTRRIASGQFSERAAANGDEEFVALATDFNRMAADLQALYADLEQRIAIKSRELAQSERLASVGFLAAGVAHEINNPLGIIAGHGERSLMSLEHGSGAGSVDQLQSSLRIICDEAFRCKRITDGLLLLARPGEEARGPVRLDRLIRDVVGTLSALPRFRDREATLAANAASDWTVIANEARLRQVVLNLAVNGLEATPACTGRVHISLRRTDAVVELLMTDNGRGMTAETLARVFEPFYTEKRGPADYIDHAGTGLGLSIVHSIVADLGGTIRAASDGPNRGSTFTVSLPAALSHATIRERS